MAIDTQSEIRAHLTRAREALRLCETALLEETLDAGVLLTLRQQLESVQDRALKVRDWLDERLR